MNRPLALVLTLLLAAFSARAADDDEHTRPEVSISLGAGLAYEFAGISLAVRSEHVEGYLGLGLASILVHGLAGGARYFFAPDGDGFFLGMNLGAHTFDGVLFDCCAPERTTRFFWATLTPGYRFAWEHVYLQAAAGGGPFYSFETNRTGVPTKNLYLLPDAMLAIGARF